MTADKPKRRGVTLAEVIVSIPLVGLVLVGALRSTGGALQTWNTAQGFGQGAALAEHLMAEILQQYYEDPDGSPAFGIEAGENTGNRKTWDDVDDYDGMSTSPPMTKDAHLLSSYIGWSGIADVDYVRLSDPTQTTASDEGLKRITVTVTDPAGAATTLVAYRSVGGALEQPPVLDAKLRTFMWHELQLDSTTLHSGARMINHAEDE